MTMRTRAALSAVEDRIVVVRPTHATDVLLASGASHQRKATVW
jgi:hypothetical protein